MKKQLKFVSLDAMIDKHIGEIGTVRRDSFENELKIELQGQIIKKTGQEYSLLTPMVLRKVKQLQPNNKRL